MVVYRHLRSMLKIILLRFCVCVCGGGGGGGGLNVLYANSLLEQ